LALFVVIALAQMMGEFMSPEDEIDEVMMAYEAPEIEEIEEVASSTVEEEPPPQLELEEELPQLSLDELDIALNPGGGTDSSLAGDFFVPNVSALVDTSQQNLKAFVDFADLDKRPRPIGVFGFNFPRRLLKKKASGKIVLLLELNHEGEVLNVEVDSSNLPDFDEFVVAQVASWKFTPPTQQGRPVQARARLPIPISIN
jgi:TonB family protein